jgi:hypothetical protein
VSVWGLGFRVVCVERPASKIEDERALMYNLYPQRRTHTSTRRNPFILISFVSNPNTPPSVVLISFVSNPNTLPSSQCKDPVPRFNPSLKPPSERTYKGPQKSRTYKGPQKSWQQHPLAPLTPISKSAYPPSTAPFPLIPFPSNPSPPIHPPRTRALQRPLDPTRLISACTISCVNRLSSERSCSI